MALVDLSQVSVWTPEKKLILDAIDWQIESGEHWVVLGLNGAGKTTLLSLVGAGRHPSHGTVRLLEETVGRTDMRALRSRIGRVDPAARALDWLNGREVVLTGLKNTVWPRWEDWGEPEYAQADALLELVGCQEYAFRELNTLSHGERQRIRIARALITSPELLLLDEPATGLDFPAREALLASLDAMAHDRPDMPSIMVSHHLEDLPVSVSHVLLLKEGRILAKGPVGQMLTSDMITECYGFPIDVHEFGGRWAARASAGWTVSHHDDAERASTTA
ncbi:MAG: ATP-binding cassette domain-containing protein [Chloroflexota bacterium]|nr:ATP-binding cassette domain-containing protein [Chloroflexota bacterium]